MDAGCGAGSHVAELIRRGAVVTSLDKSCGMLAIARQRLGPDVPLHEADLAEALRFPAGCFDVILASLVLHYLEDWRPTLREFHRVLRPGGRLVVSTHHPFMDHPNPGHADYFATYHIDEEWAKDGQTALMRFWHRPLHAMTDAFGTCGFALDLISEPQPEPAAAEKLPEAYLDLCRNPRFLFFVLSPVDSERSSRRNLASARPRLALWLAETLSPGAGDDRLSLPARNGPYPLDYELYWKVQIWFSAPLQVQTWTMVPCSPMVPRSASRHLPLATLTIFPLTSVHCWLAEPVHAVRTTRLPLRPVPSSRHPVGEFPTIARLRV
jgi:SAM-dependent methyltransferase